MKINICSIQEIRGGFVQFEGDETAPDLQMDLHFTGPISVKGTVTNTGDGLLVKAQLIFAYEVNCSRCLQEFNNRQVIEAVEQFVSGPPGDDDLVYHFTGEYIDLKECIYQQVLLALPMSFLCGPECRGLCPDCGKNLNTEDCKCISSNINPQFEKLRNLFSTEGGGPDGKSKK